MHTHCIVPCGHPDPDRVRRRLDELARTRLPGALGRALEPLVEAHPGEVVCVERVQVELDLRLSAPSDDDALAAAWARGIVAATAAAIDAGAPESARFPDRGAFIADFVADAVEGRAWRRRWHGEWDGLRSLPGPVAAAEALLREPEWIARALARLASEGRVERVLLALGERDSRRLLAELAARADAAGAESERRAAALVLRRARAEAAPTGRGWLRLAVEAGGGSGPSPAAVAVAALRLHELVAALVARRPAALEEALARHDLERASALARHAGDDAAAAVDYLAYLAAGESGDWLAEVVSPATAATVTVEPRRTSVTRLAGLYALLPALAELRLLDSARTARAGAVRALVLLKCAGQEGVEEALTDGGLARICGLADPAALASIEDDPGSDRELVPAALGALAGAGRLDGAVLAADLARDPLTGDALLVLRDCERDVWIDIRPVADTPEETLALMLASRPEPVRRADAVLVVADELASGAYANCRTIAAADVRDERAIARLPDRARERLPAFLARARDPSHALEHHGLAGLARPRRSARLDRTATVLAHALVRSFAAGLRGFEWSGAAHLWDNLLAGIGEVELADDEIRVALAPAPLSIVLRMSGGDGARFSVPWLDRPVTVRISD